MKNLDLQQILDFKKIISTQGIADFLTLNENTKYVPLSDEYLNFKFYLDGVVTIREFSIYDVLIDVQKTNIVLTFNICVCDSIIELKKERTYSFAISDYMNKDTKSNFFDLFAFSENVTYLMCINKIFEKSQIACRNGDSISEIKEKLSILYNKYNKK